MAPAIQTTPQTTISAMIDSSDTAQWVKALKATAPLVKVTRSSTLPILSAVYPAPHDAGIALSATNLNVGHTIILPGLIDQAMCVDHAGLLALLANGGDTTIDVRNKGDEWRATGTAHNATALLTAYDPDEYPIFSLTPGGDESAVCSLTSDTLSRLLGTAVLAASTDTTRGVMTGLSIEVTSNHVNVIGTDAYRLHLADAALEGATTRTTMLLPGTAAGYLVRTLPTGKDSQPATLSTAPTGNNPYAGLIITSGANTWVVCLMRDQFVNYRQIFPTTRTPYANVNAKALGVALKAMITKDTTTVRAIVVDDALLLDNGITTRTVPCYGFGNDHEMSLNGRYLLDALAPIGKGDAVIHTAPVYGGGIGMYTVHGDHYQAIIMGVTTPR